MLSILIAASLTAAPMQIQVPVKISQQESHWGILASARGSVSQSSKSTIDVALTEIVLKANPVHAGERNLRKVKLCTGKPIPKNTWKIVTCSSDYQVDLTLTSGETITKRDLTFSIPIPKREKIASFYLVLVVEGHEVTNPVIFFYAKSEGDPLQELQDLQEKNPEKRR